MIEDQYVLHVIARIEELHNEKVIFLGRGGTFKQKLDSTFDGWAFYHQQHILVKDIDHTEPWEGTQFGLYYFAFMHSDIARLNGYYPKLNTISRKLSL